MAAAALTTALLVACGQKPDTGDTLGTGSDMPDVSTTPQDVAVAEPTSVVNEAFFLSPAAMADCNPVVATVTWDVRGKHSTVSDVEILVGPDSAPTLFAAGGAYGETKTAQWAVPGAIFRLRDKATGEELERATIAGPTCG